MSAFLNGAGIGAYVTFSIMENGMGMISGAVFLVAAGVYKIAERMK